MASNEIGHNETEQAVPSSKEIMETNHNEADQAVPSPEEVMEAGLKHTMAKLKVAHQMFVDWDTIKNIKKDAHELMDKIKTYDLGRDFIEELRVLDTAEYNPAYHKFGPAAERGEMVGAAHLFPFHPKEPTTFFRNAKHQQSIGLCGLLRNTVICAKILTMVSFADKKSVALTSREAFFLMGTPYEVWDTNRNHLHGHEKRYIKVGITKEGREVLLWDSWTDQTVRHFKEEIRQYQAENWYVDQQKDCFGRVVKTIKPQPSADPMMVVPPATRGQRDSRSDDRTRMDDKHIVLTAIPFEPTKGSKGVRPRLRFHQELLSMCRSLEALNNIGHAIRSLEISNQNLFSRHQLPLILRAVPNLEKLVLRNNWLITVAHTFGIMETLKAENCTAILDLHPYYHAGPFRSPDAEEKFDNEDQYQRAGHYGLTYEDSGLHTPSVVAAFLEQAAYYQKVTGVRIIYPGSGVIAFLKRIPLPVGFVEALLDGHANLELHAGNNCPELPLLKRAHARLVHNLVVGENTPIGKKVKCLTCRHSIWSAFMRGTPSCIWCAFSMTARFETHRYRHEKIAIALDMTPKALVKEKKPLGALFDFTPELGQRPPALSGDAILEAAANSNSNFDGSTDSGNGNGASFDIVLRSGGTPPPPTDLVPVLQVVPDLEPIYLNGPDDRPGEWVYYMRTTEAQKRFLKAHKRSILLDLTRLRDIYYSKLDVQLKYEPQQLEKMRARGWQMRVPGDNEFFPQQYNNLFDSNSRGTWRNIGGMTRILRPTEQELKINSTRLYVPANSMEAMRRECKMSKDEIEVEEKNRKLFG